MSRTIEATSTPDVLIQVESRTNGQRERDVCRKLGNTLVLEDPGGEFLHRLIQGPMEIEQFLRVAIGLSSALGQLHNRVSSDKSANSVFACWHGTLRRALEGAVFWRRSELTDRHARRRPPVCDRRALDVASMEPGTEVDLTIPASVAYGSHRGRRFRVFKSKAEKTS